jgi:hypothetical protein
MRDDQPLSVSFRRNDGNRERIPLTDCKLSEAVSAVERVFSISDGLYTEANLSWQPTHRDNGESFVGSSGVDLDSIIVRSKPAPAAWLH